MMRGQELNLNEAAWRDRNSGARVIAVASGKGGVGKTNLTVNLAVELSRRGYRVAVFDADLGMANVEVLLGIVPQYTLYDYLYQGKRMDEILAFSPLSVQVISGGSGFVELANLEPELSGRLGQGLQELDRMFDFILVDNGAGISKTVLGFLAAADEVIMVITPEPTSLTDGYGLIKVLSKYHVHNRIMVVINRALDQREAQSTFQRLEYTADKFLQVQLVNLGTILEDKSVVQAVKSQKPFIVGASSSSAAQSLAGIADCLVSGKKGEEPQGAQGFFGKLIRLFGRRS
ncbi:MinD/ParA family protein [Desulforamulus ruminis]|uniref:Cobyrinic acid a,c-diamide synthase n=1 Tax=Desulforamulus ruminis (strain ATCC 23193 / DSM 2154 / NCIMB 8452 / DL) TaxID=696281 RepID=F6DNT5_DESRL|nr:MinD/ParA family protein [Desulforamulus ruminis]AEG59530.1 cobyrinic acid a,c-diamide synthase [Desulforamulus ruminis DSM 2154]